MLEQVRDIMIIISCFMVIGAALLLSILTIIVFRKISSTVDAAQGFFADLKSVSSLVSGVSGKLVIPAIKGAVFIAGLRKAISTILKRTHGKEKDDVSG